MIDAADGWLDGFRAQRRSSLDSLHFLIYAQERRSLDIGQPALDMEKYDERGKSRAPIPLRASAWNLTEAKRLSRYFDAH